MQWHQKVIAELATFKAMGVGFDYAWKRALELHPPMRMDMGPDVPTLLDEERPLVDVLHDACADAWHGRRPVMRHLVSALAMYAESDRSTTVAPGNRQRRAMGVLD